MDLHDTDDDFGARTVSRPATPEILWPAQRQYRHTKDNSPSVTYPKEGFVAAFDYDETLTVVATLTKELDTAKAFSHFVELERDKLRERTAIMEAALTRIRDCDWVITLPDRMDAVRDIARAALLPKDS